MQQDLIRRDDALICKTTIKTQYREQGWSNETKHEVVYVEDIKNIPPVMTIYGYNIDDLVAFALACRNAGIDEMQLENFSRFEELAWEEVMRRVEEKMRKVISSHFFGEEIK